MAVAGIVLGWVGIVLFVLLVIAIAIPTFLGARARAEDRAAESSLLNGTTAAKVIFTDDASYANATPTALAAIEPSVTYTTANSTGPKQLSVSASPTASGWTAAVLSESDTCFYIRDTVNANRDAMDFAKSSASGECNASNADNQTFSNNGW